MNHNHHDAEDARKDSLSHKKHKKAQGGEGDFHAARIGKLPMAFCGYLVLASLAPWRFPMSGLS